MNLYDGLALTLMPHMVLYSVLDRILWNTLGTTASTKGTHKLILVTGYEAFHDFLTNPAQVVAEKLNGTITSTASMSIHWQGIGVPVNEQGASVIAEQISSGSHPSWDAILHLGLENRSKGLKMEIIAMNIQATETNPPENIHIPCATIDMNHTKIHPDGECILPTTAPLNQLNIMESIREKMPADFVTWSRDAGAYYCNEIYYRTLYAIRNQSPDAKLIPVLFVHLPATEVLSIDEDLMLIRDIGTILVSA